MVSIYLLAEKGRRGRRRGWPRVKGNRRILSAPLPRGWISKEGGGGGGEKEEDEDDYDDDDEGISIPRRGPFPPPFFPPSPLLPSPHIHSTQIQRIRSSQPRNPPARIYRRRNQTPPSFVHTTPTPSNLLVALRRNDDDDYDDDGFRDE